MEKLYYVVENENNIFISGTETSRDDVYRSLTKKCPFNDGEIFRRKFKFREVKILL